MTPEVPRKTEEQMKTHSYPKRPQSVCLTNITQTMAFPEIPTNLFSLLMRME